ncbi:MAG: DUF975 family protein [Tissierella sp.]|nr:DUF975 family protein [Tissierella sp.]
MWTRVELKDYAKSFLKKHYWKAFLVCLIFTILAGDGSNNSSSNNNRSTNINIESPSLYEQQIIIDDSVNSIINDVGAEGFKLFGFFPGFFIGSTIFAFVLILWIIKLFIGPLITVGKNRFFLNGFKGDVNIGDVFSAFNRDEFWGIFKCIFITNLKNILWYFVFIIPGIIKSYEYSMVPYLLTKNPDLTSSEAIEISRELTDDHKWEMFVLDLSFIGWYLLGGLLFGIGVFFVTPYYEATRARLYNVLSGNDDPNEEYDIVYE